MKKYDYQEDLEETFYLSKKFEKIKQLVINDVSSISKYQIFKIRLHTYKTNLCNKIIKYILKHNKELNFQYEEGEFKNPLNNLTAEQKQKFDRKNNKFVFDYYTKYLKNDNTIFKISWESFRYSVLLIIIGKIISDPIICYNFIYNLFK